MHFQLDKDHQSGVVVAALVVVTHTVVLDTLPHRHHRHHSLFSLYFQMVMVIWYQRCLILLQETLLFGETVGMLDQLVVLCLNHTK